MPACLPNMHIIHVHVWAMILLTIIHKMFIWNKSSLFLRQLISHRCLFQVTACFKEAERIEYLIQTRSPSITSNMLLNPLLYARLRTPQLVLSSGAKLNSSQNIFILCLLHISIYFLTQRTLKSWDNENAENT